MTFVATRRLLPCALALFVPTVVAQGAADTATSPPMASEAAVGTSLQFNSTFTGYRPYTEQEVGSWREANDEVARIGGWRAYAREAAQGAAKDSGTGSNQTQQGRHEHHGSEGGKP